jgi:hypothetical protein
MGKRLQILKDWIRAYEGVSLTDEEKPLLLDKIEKFAFLNAVREQPIETTG